MHKKKGWKFEHLDLDIFQPSYPTQSDRKMYFQGRLQSLFKLNSVFLKKNYIKKWQTIFKLSTDFVNWIWIRAWPIANSRWLVALHFYKNKYEKRTIWLYAIIWKWQIRFRYTSCTHWHCSIAVLQCFRHANAKMNCRYWNFFQPGNCITYALCYVINTYTGCLTPKIQ